MNISLCMIVKNEEKNIRKSIESVKKVVNEIVVVDTGSSDNTVNVAKELGAQVYFFQWIDDFSKAKNYALSKVSKKSDWIIFIDADEYFDEASANKIRKYIKQAEKIKCEFIQGNLININKDNNSIINMSKNIRIFKNKNYICYEGRIHEYLVNKHGDKRIADTELRLFHTGYSSEVVKQKNKAERNLKLLYKQLDENPENINIKFFIAETLILDKKFEKALYYIDEVINSDDGSIDGKLAGIYERAYFYKLLILIYTENDNKKIVNFYKECIAKYDNYPDYDEIFGTYCYERQKFNIAIECFVNCLEKVERYNSIIESMSIGHRQHIRIELINSLLYIDKKTEVVKFIVSILKEEKYNSELLEILVEMLSQSESYNDIYKFLGDLYNYNNHEDNKLLIDICKKLKKEELKQLFFENLSINKRKNYDKENSFMFEDGYSDKEIKRASKKIKGLVENGKRLSVNDKKTALEYFKEAYDLANNYQLMENNKFIYVPYIAMLYHFQKYNEIEKVAGEALDLYERESIGQIDLYYYLGITEIELNKYEETINLLQNYFKLISKAEKGNIKISNSDVCYSLNLKDNAYYNIAKAFLFIGEKDMFLENLYKINNLNYIKLRLMDIIDLFLNKQYYEELLSYYDDVLKYDVNMEEKLFIKIINSKKDIILNFNLLEKEMKKHFSSSNSISDEFEGYKIQVKQTIKELINKRDIFNAESIIKEYEDIVPNDLEIVELKRRLNLLKN